MSTDDEFLRTLKDAADPRLEAGAAERIAGGAWERAATLRAAPRRFRLVTRGWLAAAAAVLVAVSVLALRGADTAFAVEGDPVMVQRGDAWIETRCVAEDSVVEVPPGERVLHWKGGGTLRPQPGSLFRFVASQGAQPISVVFERGGGEVDGGPFVVRMRDVAVERDPSALRLAFSFAMDSGGGGPRVEVGVGRAVVRSLASSDRVVLGAAEKAAVMPVSWSGVRTLRLTKLTPWSSAAKEQLVAGRVAVVDADLDARGGMMLVTADAARTLLAYQVPQADMRAAIADVNRLSQFRIAVNVQAHTSKSGRFVYESNGSRVEVVVDECGAVSAAKDGAWRRFADVAAFRREAPEMATLFGDSLER